MTTSSIATDRPTAHRLDGAWYGFMAVGFAVAGLAGVFGTYASQIPYQRAEIAEQVLDRAALAGSPAALAAMTAELGDNAAILARTDLPLAGRIAAARAATRARAAAQAADVARGLRLDIGMITLGSAAFGCFLLGAAAKQKGK